MAAIRPFRLSVYAQIQREEIAVWYENERVGLSDRFEAALEETLHSISANPFLGEAYSGPKLRKKLFDRSNTWPYAVYYQVEEHYVIVLAIQHTRRQRPQFDLP